MTRDLQNFCSFQLNFRFCFPFLIFQVQIISAQQIEQFWCLENYELFVSAEKQLADPLFSSNSEFAISSSRPTTMRQIQNSKRRFSLTSEVGLAIWRRSRGIVWLCIASDCVKVRYFEKTTKFEKITQLAGMLWT